MSNEFFQNVIQQATEVGFTSFGLTPITGDVFFDKHILEKLSFLEMHPKVKAYYFYTNFILPDHDTLATLFRMRKLTRLTASLYGHDLDSFVNITKSNEISYNRLKSNLEFVLGLDDDVRRIRFGIGWRTSFSFPGVDRGQSDLCEIVRKLCGRFDIPVQVNKLYDNWGGYIKDEDVEGLDIKIMQESKIYKNGACPLIFSKNQVMANGTVNACACRDVEATLALGDMNLQPLSEILSDKNKTYMNLIRNQEAGKFHPICQSCTFYRSIYKPLRKGTSFGEFYRRIESGAVRSD